ncbi:hypothetical protein FSARC_9618 [Fusarium sarcochroum]|uniref:Velvet domain-containing protein n=1 Tax=Fusarium sarcochroum TaxID=1208366 RepID=A0A8H4TQS1_9HYPO|nr:hypothetical protein FSARC_9618 [Fusarium sarcochroum]
MTQDKKIEKLRNSHLAVLCSIFEESGAEEVSLMHGESGEPRRLIDSLVCTQFIGKDERGQEGCFFCFLDLSCRSPGSYRLKFTAFVIGSRRRGVTNRHPQISEVKSESSTAYNCKDFRGMSVSTAMVQCLRQQGLMVSVRKGSHRPTNVGDRDDSSDGEDSERWDRTEEETQGNVSRARHVKGRITQIRQSANLAGNPIRSVFRW